VKEARSRDMLLRSRKNPKKCRKNQAVQGEEFRGTKLKGKGIENGKERYVASYHFRYVERLWKRGAPTSDKTGKKKERGGQGEKDTREGKGCPLPLIGHTVKTHYTGKKKGMASQGVGISPCQLAYQERKTATFAPSNFKGNDEKKEKRKEY